MAYIRKLRSWHLCCLSFTVIQIVVWLLLMQNISEMGWVPSYKRSWLKYTDPEDDCKCSAILEGDTEALQKAKLLLITKDFKRRVQIPNEYYINATQDCRMFKFSRKYLTFPLSQEEEDFPLAFSMVVHHKVQNFERLLRAIYVPQNVYCIHVDKKAEASVLAAVSSIASCFDNVFMVSQPATGQAKGPPPFNLPIFSGNAYIVVSRGYVHSVLEDDRVQELIKWFEDAYSPDEFLWATIQRIPNVTGSVWPNSKYDKTDINAIARLVKWAGHEGSQGQLEAVYPKCHGTHVRAVCVYGAGDLKWMIEQHHLFANKFDVDIDVIAIQCLEMYLRNKSLAEEH